MRPVRRFHVERAKKHLDLVYELEAKNLLLVLGEYIWQQEVIAPRDQWKWAVEAVSRVGRLRRGAWASKSPSNSSPSISPS